ncbi:MAG TPA: kelch repeat-containing protein [Acidimicrobiales bacterium]|nr:kelch repeat-containing protein [Acidimicrobiales bacterium]
MPGRRGRRIVGTVMALVALAACSSAGDSAGDSVRGSVGGSSSPAPGAPAELPTARTEVAGAVWQGRIVVVGGLTEAGVASARADVYDPAANRWEPVPALPLGLHHFGLAALGDRVYLAGGYHNPTPAASWEPQSRVLSLGPDETVWREESPLAGPRGGLALVAVEGRLVAIGGTGSEGIVRRVEILTPGAVGGWSPGPDLTEPRDHVAATASGGRAYAIAGRQGSLESNLATVESWDPGGGDGWRPEPRLNDTRGGTSAAEASGRPCVAGGEEPRGTIASVECLVDGRWARVATLGVPRHGLAVVGLGATLHVIGGGPQPGLFVSPAHEAFTIA